MILNVTQLKQERPDLVELFENMTKDELLKQCYLECVDALNMEERVSVFMNRCTMNMADTTYTVESINSLINDRKEFDINEFCYELVHDYESKEDLVQAVKCRALDVKNV